MRDYRWDWLDDDDHVDLHSAKKALEAAKQVEKELLERTVETYTYVRINSYTMLRKIPRLQD